MHTPTGCGMLNALTRYVASRLSIASFIGSMQCSGMLTALIIVRLFQTGPKDTLFVFLISTFAFLVLAPLAWTDARWIHDLVAYACQSSETYFPTTVVVEDEAAFKPDSAYILGLSPHSAMPTALPVVFSSYSKQLPLGENASDSSGFLEVPLAVPADFIQQYLKACEMVPT